MANLNTEQVMKRLEALEEERAILSALYHYAHYIDYGLAQEWANLFTTDGVFESHLKDGTTYKHQGTEQLKRIVMGLSKAPGEYTKHLLIEPLIKVNGNKASVESYFFRVNGGKEQPHIAVFGRYLDQMVKQDGQWRFARRLVEVEGGKPHPSVTRS